MPPNLRVATDARSCAGCSHFYVTLPGHPHDGGECQRHTEQSWRPEVVRSDFSCDDHAAHVQPQQLTSRGFPKPPEGTVPDVGPVALDPNASPNGGPV